MIQSRHSDGRLTGSARVEGSRVVTGVRRFSIYASFADVAAQELSMQFNDKVATHIRKDSNRQAPVVVRIDLSARPAWVLSQVRCHAVI